MLAVVLRQPHILYRQLVRQDVPSLGCSMPQCSLFSYAVQQHYHVKSGNLPGKDRKEGILEDKKEKERLKFTIREQEMKRASFFKT